MPDTSAVAPANPLGGAQVLEDRFQNLFEAGAFNPDGKPDQTPPAPTVAPEKTAPAQAEPAPSAAAEPDEGPDYANVEDYLTQAGIEQSSFYELPVTIKVDGKSSQVKLSDVLKSYQLEGHVQQKSIAQAERERSWQAEREQVQQVLKQQLETADAYVRMAHEQLLGDYKGIDWNKLRSEDPVRWSVLNQEFNNRANAIQTQFAQIQQAQQYQTEKARQDIAAALPIQREKMLDSRPEWRDDTKFQSARQEMTSYARKLGFSDAEIGSIFDHRYMLALHDAARFAQLQAQAPQAVKRVRAAPQVANPGARQTRDPKQAALNQAKERWKKSPRDPDAQAAYFDQLAS